jgi:hypothetical protein
MSEATRVATVSSEVIGRHHGGGEALRDSVCCLSQSCMKSHASSITSLISMNMIALLKT